MPGIWTSAITHERSSRRFAPTNSSADANVRVRHPSDLTRLSVVTRTDASSSMIATSGSFDKRSIFPDAETVPPWRHRRPDIRLHHGSGLQTIPEYRI